MKKLTLLFEIIFLCSCSICDYSTKALVSSNIESSSNYDFYHDYSGNFNSPYLSIYCWQIENNDWRCGLTPYRLDPIYRLQFLHIQNCMPCELDMMKEIIATFDENQRTTVYLYEINFPYDGNRFISDHLEYLCNKLSIPLENVVEECKK